MKNNNALKWYWPLMLLIFAGLLSGLFITGEISTYLHPKIQGLMVASLVVLYILVILAVFNAAKGHAGMKAGWGHLAFIIFFAVFFFTPKANASVTVAAENGIKFYENKQTEQSIELNVNDLLKENEDGQDTSAVTANTNEEVIASGQNDTGALDTSDQQAVSTEDKVQKKAYQKPINITEKNYVRDVDKLHMDMESNVGETVTFSGFIYREDHFDTTDMVIGRLLMYCCAADAQIVGLLCEDEHAADFEDEAWVEVTGVLGLKDYSDPNMDVQAQIPYVHITSIKRIEAPEDPYVYANY